MVKDTLKILHQMTQDFKIVSYHFEISNEILGDAYSVNAIMGTYYCSAYSANSLFHTLRKSVQMRSFFWSVFSAFGLNTERYSVSPYSVSLRI